MTLESPFEILEMESGEEVSLRVTRYEQAPVMIKPVRAPDGIMVDVLRLHLALGTKQIGAPYYDVTSKTLRAQLLPYLQIGDYLTRVFTIKKFGSEPAARFSLAIRELKVGEEIRSETKRVRGA